MKKFLLSFLIILVLLFCGAWFFASYMINSKFEETLKSNNIPLKYDSFKVGGFPFSFNITIINPEYNFNDGSNKVSIKIDGDCVLKAGLFAEKISLTTNGPASVVGNLSGYRLKIKASAKEGTYYIVNLQSSPISSSFLSNITSLSDDPKAIFKIIDYIKISGDKLKVVDLLSNTIMLNIDEYELKLSLDSAGKNKYKIELKEFLVNAIFSQSFQNLINYAMNNVANIDAAVNKVDSKIRKYFKVFNFAERGAINHNILIKYSGDLANKGDVKVDKLKLHDDLVKLNFSGVADFAMAKEAKIETDLEGKVSFSDKWYHLADKYSGSLLELMPSFSVGNSTLEKILNSLNKSSKSSSANSYVPKMHEFGEIKLLAKLNYKGKNNNSFVDVKKAEINTDLYSAALKGKYLVKNNQEKYEFDLAVKNYQRLVDEILSFASAIGNSNSLVSFASGGNFKISRAVGEKIKNFILKISNDPSNTDLLEVSAQKTFEEKYPAVGNYSSSQFEQMWRNFKTDLVVGEVSRNIKKFLPKKKGEKIQNVLENGLGKIGGILSGLSR